MISTVEKGLDLLCGPMHKIVIDFDKHVANIYMREDTCVDGPRTIKFCESVDPDVRHITTWAGDKLDTQYVNPPENALIREDEYYKGKKWVTLAKPRWERI